MEGQFDVITAHQFGLQNAVASSGTALTDDQVRLLKRFTDELLLVFDSTAPGAMRRSRLWSWRPPIRCAPVATIIGARTPGRVLRAAGEEAPKRWEE